MTPLIATSTVADGSMKPLTPGDLPLVTQARESFLQRHSIKPNNTTLVNLTYDRSNYCEYQTLAASSKGDGIIRESTIIGDGLVVTEPYHALFLPLADCIGAVLYDPTQNILMVSHLGRHNLEDNGGFESVKYLTQHHAVNPSQLKAWLSPAAGKTNYPLFAFNNQGLHEVAIQQLTSAGVPASNITASPIDSSEDQNYFSHSQFLKGKRRTDGRFAIVAMMSSLS